MARTAAGRQLTEWHQKQQVALSDALVSDVGKLWKLWSPSDSASYEAFETAMLLLIQNRASNSAAIAAKYVEFFRAIDGPTAAARKIATVPLAAGATKEQIRKSLAVTAQATVLRALEAGEPFEKAMQTGLASVSGSASRLMLQAGRDTILEEVERDSHIVGYTRVAGADACAFCAMVASRGPVYKTESTAGKFNAWHDHCNCGVEIVYKDSEWPAHSREYQDLWYESGGTLKGFRRALHQKQAEGHALGWLK